MHPDEVDLHLHTRRSSKRQRMLTAPSPIDRAQCKIPNLNQKTMDTNDVCLSVCLPACLSVCLSVSCDTHSNIAISNIQFGSGKRCVTHRACAWSLGAAAFDFSLHPRCALIQVFAAASFPRCSFDLTADLEVGSRWARLRSLDSAGSSLWLRSRRCLLLLRQLLLRPVLGGSQSMWH